MRSYTYTLIVLFLSAACSEVGSQPEAVALANTKLEHVLSVGVSEGPPEQVIGRIIDLKAADDGSFFVLDAQTAQVGWFDREGTYRGGITDRGEGPGELARPTAIAVAGDHLAVMDPRNTRLNLYRTGPTGIEYLRALRGAFSTLDAVRNVCALDQFWYVHTRRDGLMVHAVDPAGSFVRSFKPERQVSEQAFGNYTDIVRAQSSAGHVLCAADRQLVVSIDQFSASVRAYSPAGDSIWATDVPNIRPVRFIIDEQGELGLEETSDEGLHFGRTVVRWSASSVLVQYEISRTEPIPGQNIESVELSLASGEELGRTTAFPLIGDVSGDLVYAYRNDPFPQVLVLRRVGSAAPH
jgi:hypothetical protein